MSLFEDFIPYIDKYGLTSLYSKGDEGVTTQNGALFTFEYLIALLEDPKTPKHIKIAEVERLRRVYKSLEVLPGLSHRTPKSKEHDSMDNVSANLIFSAMFGGGGFAKRTKYLGETVKCVGPDHLDDDPKSGVELNYKYFSLAELVTLLHTFSRPQLWRNWAKNGFGPLLYWNNVRPEMFKFKSWFGRSPGFLGLMDLCAQGYTGPIRFLSLVIGQFLGCFADIKNVDAVKLPYVTWYFLVKGTGPFQRLFWGTLYHLWKFLVRRKHKDGVSSIYKLYYSDSAHPIIKYSKEFF